MLTPLCLTALAGSALAACPAPPPECPVVLVVGSNSCPGDIAAVQGAINSTPAGCSITLQGTFNFRCMAGNGASPLIRKQLVVQGGCSASIEGDGVSDIGPNQENGFRINAPGNCVAIQGIAFEGLDYAIDVVAGSGGPYVSDVSLTGNRFVGVTGVAINLIYARNAVVSGNLFDVPKTGAQAFGPSAIQNIGSWDTLVDGNVFKGPGSGLSTFAVTGLIDFSGSNIEVLTQRLLFRNNDVSTLDWGLITVGEHQQVRSNRFFNLGTGVAMTSALDVTVDDNCFESFGGSAVDIGGIPLSGAPNPPASQMVEVGNDQIANQGQNGVQIRVPSSGVRNDKPFGHLRNLVFLDPSYKVSEIRVGGTLVDHRKNPYKPYVQVGPPARVTVRSDGYPWWTGALPKDMSVKTTRPSPNTSVLTMVAGSSTRPVCPTQSQACPSGDFTAPVGEEAGAPLAPVSALASPPLPVAAEVVLEP